MVDWITVCLFWLLMAGAAAALAAGYFLPTIVVALRRGEYLGEVIVLNLFLGWTFLGWVASLALAVSGPSAPAPPGPVPLPGLPPTSCPSPP